MKCPKCQVESVGNMKQCNVCGYRMEPVDDLFSQDSIKTSGGLRRTLSTELAEKQTELRIQAAFNSLITHRTFEAGEVIIKKGDLNRDLFILTEGVIEISTESAEGTLVLNEITPPYLLGDIGFLSGLPRTATARAKTKTVIFILKYENLMDLVKGFPEWVHPLLTSISSSIKSLHFQNGDLKKELAGLKKK